MEYREEFVRHLGQWKKAGFQPAEAREWMQTKNKLILGTHGYPYIDSDPEVAKEWKEAGFTPTEVVKWHNADYDRINSPEDVLKWKNEGFSFTEVSEWENAGIYDPIIAYTDKAIFKNPAAYKEQREKDEEEEANQQAKAWGCVGAIDALKLFGKYYMSTIDSVTETACKELINTYESFCTNLSIFPTGPARVEQMLSDNEGLFSYTKRLIYIKFPYTFSNTYYSGPVKLTGCYTYHSAGGPFVTVPAFKALQY